ncbi:MAG: PQQ-binding-like beta-propeller repeat protein [Phycisphaerales bacterium]
MHDRHPDHPAERPGATTTPNRGLIDELIFVNVGGHVAAIDRLSGELVWRWKAPKGHSYGSMLVQDDALIVGVYGYVYCLDALSGELRWSNPLRGFGFGVTSLATSGAASGHANSAASQSQQAAAAIAAASAS